MIWSRRDAQLVDVLDPRRQSCTSVRDYNPNKDLLPPDFAKAAAGLLLSPAGASSFATGSVSGLINGN
jgi:hypothetical protein